VFTPFPEDLVAHKRYQFIMKQTPNTHKAETAVPPLPSVGNGTKT
jgi:hypothetical protein